MAKKKYRIKLSEEERLLADKNSESGGMVDKQIAESALVGVATVKRVR